MLITALSHKTGSHLMHIAYVHKKLQLSSAHPPFTYKPAEDQPSHFYNWTGFEIFSSPQKQTVIQPSRGTTSKSFCRTTVSEANVKTALLCTSGKSSAKRAWTHCWLLQQCTCRWQQTLVMLWGEREVSRGGFSEKIFTHFLQEH